MWLLTFIISCFGWAVGAETISDAYYKFQDIKGRFHEIDRYFQEAMRDQANAEIDSKMFEELNVTKFEKVFLAPQKLIWIIVWIALVNDVDGAFCF